MLSESLLSHHLNQPGATTLNPTGGVAGQDPSSSQSQVANAQVLRRASKALH